MEGLGKKLQEARLARNLSIDEAARITKIRPARLQEIENEDFSEFPSLAYAKGFLLIYGKFLDVDVSPYLEAFETSDSVTVDGYSYLQDNPVPKPTRTSVPRRQSSRTATSGGRGSFLPFLIGVIVLVFGFVGMKWILEIQRLKPAPQAVVGTLQSPTPASETIIAPKASLLEQATSPAPPPPSPQPTVPASPLPQPSAAEPEVRRAEPVHAEDVPKVKATPPPVRRVLRTPVPNAGPRPIFTPRPVQR